MDPATLIGLVLAFGALLAMITLEGSSVTAILLPAPMVLVFGATLAVGLAGGTMKDFTSAFQALPGAFLGKTTPPQAVIDQVVGLAETARGSGLLALDQEADNVTDPFLRGALQNIADGTDGDELRMLLEDEIATKARTNRNAAKFFTGLGGYAPTIGIVGTVVALTHVLENLSTPATLGPMIATAFVATLWGLLSANFIWLPLGSRLRRLADLEVDRMTLVMEGALAVQAGSQPRLLGERLRAMVPAELLPKIGAKGKDGAEDAAGGATKAKGKGKGKAKDLPKAA
ncbi:motility protein A [Cryobacterium sp. TMT1-3]|uniref:Motility protein A n=1 Tax=Cryobacterium luteum TaxID=1424661 RepID=A0A1H8GVC4_9MICO|nr:MULTISPECIES: MotA/TolQ/ExbB proton channel family protein [Cryobacterium]TFB84580.1 motility protein A [Cryobacterium luteum]TFC28472.1 motility protein A [Cryobacterium sp. TMT1-3]SEN48081.1 chemotaxis protein MotA [Cryobacterium luteum]